MFLSAVNYICLLYFMGKECKSLKMTYFKLQSHKLTLYVSISSKKYVHKYCYSVNTK